MACSLSTAARSVRLLSRVVSRDYYHHNLATLCLLSFVLEES